MAKPIVRKRTGEGRSRVAGHVTHRHGGYDGRRTVARLDDPLSVAA